MPTIIAALPDERGQMSKSLRGYEIIRDAMTSSTVTLPFRCACGFLSALRRARNPSMTPLVRSCGMLMALAGSTCIHSCSFLMRSDARATCRRIIA